MPFHAPDVAVQVFAGFVIDESFIEGLLPHALGDGRLAPGLDAAAEQIAQIHREDPGLRICRHIDDELVVPHIVDEPVMDHGMVEHVLQGIFQRDDVHGHRSYTSIRLDV
ncbi:hypothetical protein ABGB12_17705 [Actinocorallia sp. B10E7]|uniref:hypothetical protein n=1 Tax=Actinocorallia sp. B10E7 TaxID=3153558 RepID=UPI00325DAA34